MSIDKNSRLRQVYATVLTILLSAPCVLSEAVTVSWDANSEADLIGYRVYYGNESRQYHSDLYVGSATSYKFYDLEGNQTWYFAVTALDYAGNESDLSDEVSVFVERSEDSGGEEQDPDETEEEKATPDLSAYNFPNPLKIGEQTTIRYQLEEASRITIDIFDLREQRITTLISDESKALGEHIEDSWDGTNDRGEFVANGVYLCRIQTESHSEIIKIAVTR